MNQTQQTDMNHYTHESIRQTWNITRANQSIWQTWIMTFKDKHESLQATINQTDRHGSSWQ